MNGYRLLPSIVITLLLIAPVFALTAEDLGNPQTRITIEQAADGDTDGDDPYMAGVFMRSGILGRLFRQVDICGGTERTITLYDGTQLRVSNSLKEVSAVETENGVRKSFRVYSASELGEGYCIRQPIAVVREGVTRNFMSARWVNEQTFDEASRSPVLSLSFDVGTTNIADRNGKIPTWVSGVVADSSGLQNDLGRTGSGVAFVAGRSGRAAKFDGKDYLFVGTGRGVGMARSLDSDRGASASVWVKPDALTRDWQPIYYQGGIGVTGRYGERGDCAANNCANRKNALFLRSDGSLVLASTSKARMNRDGQLSCSTPAQTARAGTWQHIATVIDSRAQNAQMKIYVDGVEKASCAYDASGLRPWSANDEHVFLLGKRLSRIGEGSERDIDTGFHGLLDDFQFYRYTLTAEQIQNLAAVSSSTGPPENPNTGGSSSGPTAPTPSAACGNGIIDDGEHCDGTNLNSQTCQTQGFTGGSLSCSSNCQFVTSACTSGGQTDSTIMLHLPLNTDDSSTSFHDASGDNHNAGCSGSTCPTLVLNSPGHSDTVLFFDGNDDLATVSDNIHSDEALTISAWAQLEAKPASTPWHTFVMKSEGLDTGVGLSNREYGLSAHNDGRVSVGFTPVNRIGVGALGCTTSAGQLSGWTHVAGVIDKASKTSKVYINGVLVQSCTHADTFTSNIRTSSGAVAIGRKVDTTSSAAFKGSMDDVRIYGSALSASEIQALAND